MPKQIRKKTLSMVLRTTSPAKTAAVRTFGLVKPAAKSPDEALKDLFREVQEARVYADGKTFVDRVPAMAMSKIVKKYEKERESESFSLAQFVDDNFHPAVRTVPQYQPSKETTAREHVKNLWPILKRRNRRNRGSLIALPYSYVTPGGRFEEQFYWDSYFIMLGLAEDGEWRLVYDMMRNYSYMLRKFGRIPTANRTYFLSRSQPPIFAHMVQLLARRRGARTTYAEFLPSMLAEYRFWMKGDSKLSHDNPEKSRVVLAPNGVVLNRYFDDKSTPRPESQREDIETARSAKDKEKVYLDLRAAAESGWDFSSRWFRDAADIRTIETTSIIPVDLNCLLYDLEQTIASTYRMLHQKNLAEKFEIAAERRAASIHQFFWNNGSKFFEDYHMYRHTTTGQLTLAGVFPLYVGIADDEQAAYVAQRIEQDFLKEGGLITTLINNGQQWDSPNGWAPLQWIAIKSLRRYGYDELADKIRRRWLSVNDSVYATERKMIEKYDVVANGIGGGGEYELQDGFGWTNGVYAALKDEEGR